LLLCTQSPDYFLPTTACLLQKRLGIPKNCGALDFNLGCSGFVYGLALAGGLIRSECASSVLLITAETYTKFIQPEDRSLRTIFGDAAATTLLAAITKPSLNMILIPATLAYGVISHLRGKKVSWKFLIFAVVVPSVVILAAQCLFAYRFLPIHGDSRGVGLSKPFEVMLHYCDGSWKTLAVRLASSMVFPLASAFAFIRMR
jgi:hypothetical protein